VKTAYPHVQEERDRYRLSPGVKDNARYSGKIKKSKTNCFPVNAWFDEECKKARRRWKESDKDKTKLKAYQQIVRKKKVDFMISRREELIFLGKNNPKLFWKELQPKKVQTENNITASEWFDYAR
jgi:hypothetical protein